MTAQPLMTNAPTPAGMAVTVLRSELSALQDALTFSPASNAIPVAKQQVCAWLAAQPSAGAEPVAWRVVAIEDGRPIGKWSLVEDGAWAREHPSLYRAEPLGVIATHPAPVHAASDWTRINQLRTAIESGRRQINDGQANAAFANLGRALEDDTKAVAALTKEAPDWTAATEAAWAENNTKEAPAATGAGEREKTYRQCPSCFGKGRIFKNGVRTYDCPNCAGSGKLPDIRAQPQAREEAQPDSGGVVEFDPEAHELVQVAVLCREAIESVQNWSDNGHLMTAHCHASVLAEDLSAALAPVAAEGGEKGKLRIVYERWTQEKAEGVEVIEAVGAFLSALRTEPTGGGEG